MIFGSTQAELRIAPSERRHRTVSRFLRYNIKSASDKIDALMDRGCYVTYAWRVPTHENVIVSICPESSVNDHLTVAVNEL